MSRQRGTREMGIARESRPSVGIEEIDRQHREILGHWELIVRAAERGNDYAVRASLRTLDRLVCQHFEAEELWMEANGYPGGLRHARAHQGFRAQLAALRETLAAAQPLHTAREYASVSAWLRDHIGSEDVQFGRFRAARENLRRLAGDSP